MTALYRMTAALALVLSIAVAAPASAGPPTEALRGYVDRMVAVIEDGSLGCACRSAVVVRSDRVQKLCADGGLERRGAFFDQAQAEVDVSEQSPLLGRAKGRPARELDGASDVVQQRRRQQEVGAQPWMELSNLPADRRHADRVFEQASGVAVMSLDRRR